MKKDKSFKDYFKSPFILHILVIIIIVLSLINIFIVNDVATGVSEKLRLSQEEARPANLELITIKDALCVDCFNVDAIAAAIKQQNIKLTKEKSLDYSSEEVKQLINKYSIKKIPTLIVSGEINKNPQLNALLSQLGETREGAIIFSNVPPVYIDLTTNAARGRVEIINIFDSSCAECYNVSIQRQILERNFGVVVFSEKNYDTNSSQGKTLIKNYNITKVPTIVFSPEASVYPALNQIWPQVGTIENDGWYVFRNMEALTGAAYKDLLLNKTINTTVVK